MISLKLALKIATYAVPAIILAALAWNWQGNRLERCRIELVKSNEAAITSNRTVERIITDREQDRKTCEQLVRAKSKVIADMQAIDRLRGGPREDSTDDPVLGALNGMYP